MILNIFIYITDRKQNHVTQGEIKVNSISNPGCLVGQNLNEANLIYSPSEVRIAKPDLGANFNVASMQPARGKTKVRCT